MSMGIYKITNRINGKIYIGQSIHIEKRFRQHQTESYYQGKHYNKILYQAIRKYGLENFTFEILEECSQDMLNEKEIYWIKYYDSYNNGYNATLGGENNFFSINIPSEEIYKMWNEGKTVKEIKEFFHINGETVRKRLVNLDTYSEHEARVRAGKKNAPNSNLTQKIVQYDLSGNIINKFDSISEISKKFGYDMCTIKRCIEGKTYSSHNFRWGLENCPLPNEKEIKDYKYKIASQSHQNITDEQLIEAIKNSKSYRQALLSVGLNDSGANYKRLKKIIEQYPELKKI